MPENKDKQCVHYWIIEMTFAPTSPGKCQYCGEERQFENHPPTLDWGIGSSGYNIAQQRRHRGKAPPGDEG